jgi:ssDNA-binding replication factor A large subunit
VKFNFRKFDVLEHAEPNSTVDVCGVVKRCGDCQELMSKKTGTALFKRDLTLADDSVTKRGQHAIAQSENKEKSRSNPF